MNDAEALAEINRILELLFDSEISQVDALAKIAQITGINGGAK